MEFNLPSSKLGQETFAEGYERRREHRYQLELPMRLALEGPRHERRQAAGMAQDLSKTGIYFVTPATVMPDESVQLEVVVPDEITHRGDVALRFNAQPVRVEQLNGAAGFRQPVLGVAARVEVAKEKSEDKESLQPARDSEK